MFLSKLFMMSYFSSSVIKTCSDWASCSNKLTTRSEWATAAKTTGARRREEGVSKVAQNMTIHLLSIVSILIFIVILAVNLQSSSFSIYHNYLSFSWLINLYFPFSLFLLTLQIWLWWDSYEFHPSSILLWRFCDRNE